MAAKRRKTVFTRKFVDLLANVLELQREVKNAREVCETENIEIFEDAILYLEDCKHNLCNLANRMNDIDDVLNKMRGKGN